MGVAPNLQMDHCYYTLSYNLKIMKNSTIYYQNITNEGFTKIYDMKYQTILLKRLPKFQQHVNTI